MSNWTSQYLAQVWLRGTQFLGSRYGILGGAMSWLSESELVSSISEAGGFGVLACGAMNPQRLRCMIQDTKKKRPLLLELT